jgi:hypothetical protein
MNIRVDSRSGASSIVIRALLIAGNFLAGKVWRRRQALSSVRRH